MKKYILASYFILGASVSLICQSISKSIGLGIGSMANPTSIISDPDGRLRNISAVNNIQVSFSLKQISNTYSHRLQFSLTAISIAHGDAGSFNTSISSYDYSEFTYRFGKCIPLFKSIYTAPSVGVHLLNRRPYSDSSAQTENPKSTFGGSGMVELVFPYKRFSLSLYSKIYIWTKSTFRDRSIEHFDSSGTLESSSEIRAMMPTYGFGLEVSFDI